MMQISWLGAIILGLLATSYAFTSIRTNNRDSSLLTVSTRTQHVEARRSFLTTVATASTALVMQPTKSIAAGSGSMDEDKAKIVSGYKRLTYLLDNWDKETTTCSGTEKDPFTGQPVCVKTPLVVQQYMGYKSINDPLFKADKTLRRLEALVPASRANDYFDATEAWATAADEASGMAYTSSWAGPQNPNGGDESIAYYLERAKKQVVDARSILKTVMDILDLKA